DLLSGRLDLAEMQGLVAVGGFSYGDVLGAGEGWARTIRFNSKLSTSSPRTLRVPTPLRWAVCNGCQMMAALAPMIPGPPVRPPGPGGNAGPGRGGRLQLRRRAGRRRRL
ncbi:hypothetical protein CTI14_56555, partial [Methylobacterium radiotolerans]